MNTTVSPPAFEKLKTIQGLVEYTKTERGFNARKVLDRKIELINEFFTRQGLDAAVIALSGGIDSSLVLKLLLKAASKKGSPIKRISGIFLPIYSKGTTGQKDAELHVRNLIGHIKEDIFTYNKYDLSSVAYEYYRTMNFLQNNTLHVEWLHGQIASIVRTPAVYGQAAFLQTCGYNSIVVGTTNRDEGAYIGFFGKASDGMVDLQPIADLHKSEVMEISKLLQVPNEIITRTPKGDVWDNKVDEEMIGAPYWFLEMYQILKRLENEPHLTETLQQLTDCPEALTWAKNIETLHSKNLHKYKVGSPAHYIDVLQRTI
jgi:NAD+ synthetase